MVAYKSFGCNLNKCSHSEFGVLVEKVCIFTNNYLTSLFSFILPTFLNFKSAHSKILLGFIGYGIISRDFFCVFYFTENILCVSLKFGGTPRLGLANFS